MKKVKIIILGDGMADMPYIEKDGKKIPQRTPLLEAKIPVIDALAPCSEIGLVKTVPNGMKPGSDIANLSVMGYDPARYYTGRSPLEAVSIGIDLKAADLAIRCNLVTLDGEGAFEDRVMYDYSAGEISSAEGGELVKALGEYFGKNGFNLLRDFGGSEGFESFKFYGGVSYRNCLVIENGVQGTDYTPPHDISGKRIGAYLPKGVYGESFVKMLAEAHAFLSAHPINAKRRAEGKNPANAVWLWGEGRKPALDDFFELNGRRGAVVSAVDLIKGIGLAANMRVIEVEGATGTVHTNFKGKTAAVLKAVREGIEFVYLHIEAADECGHHGDREGKILSIERIDETIGRLKSELERDNIPYTFLVLPDHPTPLSTMTHNSDPVPYLMYDSENNLSNGVGRYDEISAEKGRYTASGPELFRSFLEV
ncbi:MAG: cofactor-independent phosphoglycerate mutase [Clostridiales bacterium]|jgi:2,3-bisphosphoglycerate-independent phosphoglycerate mutase|nr:cofactor-independent phosphoglycerate mutase [Clostridiales bacterium]